jgi:hypothetical protein
MKPWSSALNAATFVSPKELLGTGAAQSLWRLGCGLDDGFSFSGRGTEGFFLQRLVQIGSRAHPASYPMGTGVITPGIYRQGREVDHSPPSSAEVKNAWLYTSIPLINLPGVVLSEAQDTSSGVVFEHRDNFTFSFCSWYGNC